MLFKTPRLIRAAYKQMDGLAFLDFESLWEGRSSFAGSQLKRVKGGRATAYVKVLGPAVAEEAE